MAKAAPAPPTDRGKRILSPSAQIQGAVERMDLAIGIEGWAVDVEEPERKLSVELFVGDEAIARVTADRPRSDLPIASGSALRIGFIFPTAAHDRIREIVRMGRDGALSVEVVETGMQLPLPALPSTLASGLAREPEGTRLDTRLDMLAHLGTLKGRAAAFPARPLRADGDNLAGFIEQVAIDEAGLVWFSGWMKRATAADMPVLVIDGQKLAAGMAMTMYQRDDLGGEACGIIGVLHSDWRPTSTSELFIFLDDQQSYLQSVKGMCVISKRELAEHLAFHWPRCGSGHGNILRHLLDHPESWEPIEGLSGAQVRAATEQVFVIPSFGCLAIGWAMSPFREVSGFAVKFGTTVLPCDPTSISFRTRTDLATMAAGRDRLIQDAGFVAVFRGCVADHEIDDATLKVILADGSSSNHRVDVGAIRLLGHAASVEHLLYLYPTLASEPFFPDLARALCAGARSAAEAMIVVEAASCKHALVFAVPDERSDAYLLFSEVERRIAASPTEHGILFAAGRGAVRSDVIALFRALAARSPGCCGLYLVDDPAAAFYALPNILASAGADSFAFFGAGMLPTEQGWRAACAADGQLVLFEIKDPCRLHQNDALSLEAIGWSRAQLIDWLDKAPPYLNGPRTMPTKLIEAAPHQVSDAAWLLRSDALTPLLRSMNQALGETA